MAIIEQIYQNTYVIREVGCAGEVNMYLMVGKDKALLIDCGYGAADLPALIKTVTDLPVTVVCTHGHIDHAFDSWMFEDVYLHPADKSVYLEHGDPAMQKDSWDHMDMRMLKFYHVSEADFLEGKKRALSHTPGIVKDLADQQCFDLGGRTAKIILMPGHTMGSIIVEDMEQKVLFSGDNMNGQVWLFLKESTSLPEYKKQLERIRNYAAEHGILLHYPGHGRKAVKCSSIDKLIHCCEKGISQGHSGKTAERVGQKAYIARSGLLCTVLYK